MHSKIFNFFWFECIQGTKLTLVLRVQRRALFLSMSTGHLFKKFFLKIESNHTTFNYKHPRPDDIRKTKMLISLSNQSVGPLVKY